MKMNIRLQASHWLSIGSCLALFLSGCGSVADDGPKRFAVNGSVSFNGTPVPYGEIFFEPDGKKGNKGPGARGVIQDGKYSITENLGVVPGALRVRISGNDGIAPPGGGTMPHGKSLFTESVQSVEQPQGQATHDFQIKGAALK